ncbi:MAG: extracellular solute-binding protein, partial [Clostridiales bacterium]|nr:extracellular solute-binding protein [Clostridiales bacterium]
MKRAAAVLLALACLLALTGCSSLGGGGETESVRLMVWSPSEDQSQDSGQWLQTCCENFAALHPEWDITFVYGVADEATAADTVAQDPEASADVFMYANDNITTMTDAQALAKFGGVYEEEIRASNSDALLDSLTLDGYLYGVPYTTNTWFLYY